MKRYMILSVLLMFSVTLFAANTDSTAKVKMEVQGTSTLHDWTMTSEKATVEADLTSTDGTFTLNSLTGTVPVESLKSGKDGMDENAWEALKSEDHPNITYTLTQPLEFKAGESVKAQMDVTIAGNTQTLEVEGTVNSDNSGVLIEGAHKMKMSDFDIEPPSFMFGSISTGDKVTIDYQLNLTAQK